MLGNKNNLTNEERYKSDQKIQQNIVIFYLISVFTYSLAIVILSYSQYVNFNSTLPKEFELLIYNWEQNPIKYLKFAEENDLAKVTATFQNQKIQNYSIDNENVQFTIEKLDSFTFINNYTLRSDCDYGFQLCGGVELNSKYCININQITSTFQCPFNDFLTQQNFTNGYLKNYTVNLQNFSNYFYETKLQIKKGSINKTIMLLSSVQSRQPVTNLRFGFNGKICKDPNEFQECTETLLNYQEIQKMKALEVLNLNSISEMKNITVNDTIGLYAERYIEFHMDCRYTLIERVLESPEYYKSLGYILYIQTLFTLVYCIFIGIILNLFHFFMLSDFTFILVLPILNQKQIKIIRRIVYTIRIGSFLSYGTIICLLYFYEAQFHDTINRIVRSRCLEDNFLYIMEITLDEIDKFRENQIAIFWIFIVGLIFEVFACFIIVYRGANVKKKNLLQKQYEHELEIKHDEQQNLFKIDQKQAQNRILPRQSFTPNDKQIIRQSVMSERSSSRRTQNNNVLADINEQDEFKNQRESIKPVFQQNQSPLNTLQSPNNFQGQKIQFNP
ncbi:unnamed protein product [Paramecium sonneborni]|uniref:Transmembrane protein n=1 Tax=Paramecium sonneborni TaxID=65129 RepID=A0A8S1QZ76_9CILI|nr:unnamed protein product [Paramecium sonneborni]